VALHRRPHADQNTNLISQKIGDAVDVAIAVGIIDAGEERERDSL